MRVLGYTDESESPETVVAALHRFVDDWNSDDLNVKTEREHAIIAMCLGIAWGHQITREMNWEWAVLEQDGLRSYAVVSPDRAYSIHPTVLMSQFLQRTRENTTLPFFHFLRARDFPWSAPKAYRGLA
jgi:hypothetical protein